MECVERVENSWFDTERQRRDWEKARQLPLDAKQSRSDEEAMHYGTGAYGLYAGGVNQFSRDRTFRGVAYKDGSGQLWFYGNVSRAEAESLRPCR